MSAKPTPTTSVVIDAQLIRAAMKASGLTTRRAAVETGLRLLVDVKAQAGTRRLRGKVVWDGNLAQTRSGPCDLSVRSALESSYPPSRGRITRANASTSGRGRS
jgi:Arc/MetJ family transcription regulator